MQVADADALAPTDAKPHRGEHDAAGLALAVVVDPDPTHEVQTAFHPPEALVNKTCILLGYNLVF